MSSESDRIGAVLHQLRQYVQSPSLKHIRDHESLLRLAKEIIKIVQAQSRVWGKWEPDREEFIQHAVPGCWIPIADLRDYLNRLPGPALTTTDIVERLEHIME